MSNSHPLHERLMALVLLGEKKSVSIKEILHTLGGKGKEILLIFLSLPFCQPVQIPGTSTPFGLVIALIGIAITFKRKQLWLPKFLHEKKLKGSTVKTIAEKSLRLVSKTIKWIHPRMKVMTRSHMMIFNGLIIIILGLLLALPLPIPLTNIVAAWGIFLMSLGLLEEDGLFVAISYGIGLGCIIFFLFIILSLNRII